MTTDLISRQAAIDAVRSYYDEQYALCDSIEELIERLPSAQPEIIRCEDCKYYHPAYCEVWSRYGTVQTREAGYCYMAERREE